MSYSQVPLPTTKWLNSSILFSTPGQVPVFFFNYSVIENIFSVVSIFRYDR